MNTLTEDELKELARQAIKAGDDEHEEYERREITRAVVKYLGGEKITEAPVKHWPLLQAMFEHWIETDNPLLTAKAKPTVGTVQELNLSAGDVVECISQPIGGGLFTEGKQYVAEQREDAVGVPYDDVSGIGVLTHSRFRIISRAADTKRKETVAIPPVVIPDETPLDHFGQSANDNDGVPQTSKDAYAEIARSLGHAVIAHVEAGDYEQALKCAGLMRRAEMEPVEALKVTVTMDDIMKGSANIEDGKIFAAKRDLTRFGHTGGFVKGQGVWWPIGKGPRTAC